jgi:4-aminobutyrate aminotransferase
MSEDLREGDVNLGPRRQEWIAAHRGPEASAAAARDAAVFLKQSLSSPCLTDVVRAEGAWLEDSDGRRYLDFHGNSVHHLGHGHPRVKAAIAAQMDELPFAPRRFACGPATELAERLSALSPGAPRRVLFAPGGAEAIEIAVMIARLATGRHKTLSFWDAFHGATMGAAALGGEALFRSHGVGPLPTGAAHVAPFACFRCPYGFPSPSGAPDLDACRMACARMVRYVLEREGDVAAVVAEPIRAAPYLPPPGFWSQVRKACDEVGALLIFDEIPTGLGRTGRLFASEHAEVDPDIIVLGKSLGGGILPLAAVLAKPELDRMAGKAIGHFTHEKNPVLARAGLATLEVIEQEGLVARAERLGARALAELKSIRHPLIAEARGVGLLLGLDLSEPNGEPAVEAAERLLYAALARGLSFKVTMGSILTLAPPLTISEDDLRLGLERLKACFAEIEA